MKCYQSVMDTVKIISLVIFIFGLFFSISVVGEEILSQGPSGDQVVPEFAKGFTVTYHDSYKEVKVLNPWRDSKETFTYILVRPGSKAPDVGRGVQLIEIPVERFVSLSSTHLPYLPILGLTDTLKGTITPDKISTQEVLDQIRDGKVIDVSGGGSGMATGVNLETLIDLSPDLVMAYATGLPEYDSHPKLLEAGIPVVVNAEYMEEDPLGRAEWAKFIAVFFDKEKEANEYFEKIKKEYQSLEQSISTQSRAKPTVFLNNNWQGTWYMAGGKSYVGELLKDAGADYLWSTDTTTGSIPLDFEVVYDTALDAEYWINPGTASTMKELLGEDARYADFAAVKTNNVYNNNARVNAGGGNDYWESGVAHPEIILKDLVKIFHPEILPDHNLVYYQKLE